MNKQRPRYIDIHIIQPIPFSLLNRDDLGQHKTLTWSTPRLRVSSQSWKRAARSQIEAQIGDPAVRTLRVAAAVAGILTERGWDADTAAVAGTDVVTALGLKPGKDAATKSLVYLTRSQLADLADLAEPHRDAYAAAAAQKAAPKRALADAEAAKSAVSRIAGTVALLGRMLAEVPGSAVTGAVSVAHAFTTHTAAAEEDFFTAVDDANTVEQTGSGHMGHTEFGAGVYYRYACLDTAELLGNLDGDAAAARELAEAFVHAFVRSLPGGKSTAAAHFSEPDLIALRVRSDNPQNLAGAFEAPVPPGRSGTSAPSRQRLNEYAARSARMLGSAGLTGGWVVDRDELELDGLGQPVEDLDGAVELALKAVDL